MVYRLGTDNCEIAYFGIYLSLREVRMTRLSGSLVGAEALLLADGDFETKRCKLRGMEDGLQTSKLWNRFCYSFPLFFAGIFDEWGTFHIFYIDHNHKA